MRANLERFLNERETSQVLGLSMKTLQRWRLQGDIGPAYRKLGKAVRYSESDIREWLERAPTGCGAHRDGTRGSA
jgi:predicted DNA-binding transcriptional regulator AlpA